jgi:hypothetical protein
MIKEIVRAWGMDPEKVFVKEILMEAHRTVISRTQREENHIHTLTQTLRKTLRKELLD